MFGLGVEINLPIPKVDLRIPLALRGSANPGVSDKRVERARHVTSVTSDQLVSVSYNTEWKFQAVGSFGLSGHF